jgi:hypothetical protein
MVAPGRVDQKHVRQLWQGANGGFKECAFAEGEQARLVRRACTARQHRRAPADARGCPRPVADTTGAAFPAGEADEDAADLHVRRESPRCRSERGQPRLLLDQLLARERPLEHGRILAHGRAGSSGARSGRRERVPAALASMLRSLTHGTSKPLGTLPQGMRLAVLGERADIEIARERLTRRHSLGARRRRSVRFLESEQRPGPGLLPA